MRLREASLAVAQELRRRADLLEADAKRKAEALRDQASQLESVTGELDAESALRNVNIGGRVNTSMVSEHRVAISKGRTPRNPFMAKVQASGLTLRSLADKLKVPVSLLSMYRTGGGRPIPRDRAERIAKLTGWPADLAHWPNGFA